MPGSVLGRRWPQVCFGRPWASPRTCFSGTTLTTGCRASGKTRDVKAIYELTDHVLRVCFSKGGTERPKDFNTKGIESAVYTFKRTKAQKR